uniref:SCP domain-containing protein n=1 Tax=Anaerobacillus isosaccharinicus TaxID=1532552 RepID=A0A1S2LSF6_9BACI
MIKRAFMFTLVLLLVFTSNLGGVLAGSTVNPYQNKKLQELTSGQEETLIQLNEIRNSLGIQTLTLNDLLNKTAQSHSNYQYELNQNTGHVQPFHNSFFTGTSFYDRFNYYGYAGVKGGEVIAPININLSDSLEKLIDAPYHRMGILNPNHAELGVGFNRVDGVRSALVMTMGANETYLDSTVVKYPYNNQQNVKISWFNNERPNPLESIGLNRVHVGYPITLSFGDANLEELITNHASLRDSGGIEVDSYIVKSTNETTFKRHVMIIPKTELKSNETYTVNVVGERKLFDGPREPVNETWSFTTARQLELSQIGIRNDLNMFTFSVNAGDLRNLNFNVFRNGQLFHSYRTINERTSQFRSNRIVAGEYEVRVDSPYFSNIGIQNIEVIEENGVLNIKNKQQNDTNPSPAEPIQPTEPDYSQRNVPSVT